MNYSLSFSSQPLVSAQYRAMPAVFLFSALLVTLGCNQPQSNVSTEQATASKQTGDLEAAVPVQSISWRALNAGPGLSHTIAPANDVWNKMVQKFRSAQQYVDQAEWNLQYRINGQLYVETQPVSLRYDRSTNRWYSQGFRTQCLNDSQLTTIQINEVATNNLDQQVKVVDSRVWTSIFADPIARVYLSGATDFPLSENSARWPQLFFPQLSWLNEGLEPEYFPKQDWQNAGTGVFKQSKCQIIRQGKGVNSFELWIDTNSYLPVRMFVPNRSLDFQLTQTPGVSDLRLSLDFSNIQFDQPANIPKFQRTTGQKLVKQFVKVPEAFPSSYIGKPSPQINWTIFSGTHANGRSEIWQLEQYAGRTIVAIFLPPEQSIDSWVNAIAGFRQRRELDSTEVLLVPIVSTPGLNELASRIPNSTLKLVENGWSVWSELGLRSEPTMVAWDGHGIVQYATVTDLKEIQKQTLGCISQITAGHSVASDMIDDYRKFYERYQRKLSQVSLQNLPTGYQSKPALSAGPVNRQPAPNTIAKQALDPFSESLLASDPLDVELVRKMQSDQSESAERPTSKTSAENWNVHNKVTLKPIWQTKLLMPLSAVWTQSEEKRRFYVLDGYRTIQSFSTNGSKKDTINLELPDGIGVSQIRAHSGSQSIVAFQPGGHHIFVFDHAGKLKSDKQTQSPIIDIQILPAFESPSSFSILLASQEEEIQSFADSDLQSPLQSWPIKNITQLIGPGKLQSSRRTSVGLAITGEGHVIDLQANGTATSIAAPQSAISQGRVTSVRNRGNTFLLSAVQGSKAGWWNPRRPKEMVALNLAPQILRLADQGELSIISLQNGYIFHGVESLFYLPAQSRTAEPIAISSPIKFAIESTFDSNSQQITIGTSDGKIVTFETISRLSQRQPVEHR